MSSFSAWAGSDLEGIDEDTDLEVILTLSVLAKSNSCGVGDVPVVLSTGLRLGIGEVAEYEVALEIKVGRLSCKLMLCVHSNSHILGDTA
jgi:hypothetical protein